VAITEAASLLQFIGFFWLWRMVGIPMVSNTLGQRNAESTSIVFKEFVANSEGMCGLEPGIIGPSEWWCPIVTIQQQWRS